jgi:hypothetical protein
MAYMSQEKKKALAVTIKNILKTYGMKGTLSVNNHSTLVLTLTAGKLDIIGNLNETIRASGRTCDGAVGHVNVNHYWFRDHYTGRVKTFLEKIIVAMNAGNHDNSDIRFDYFDVGWYIDINVGRWNKPYQLLK